MSSTNRGAERQKFDQYFTPDAVASALVEIVASRIYEPARILEPSCGSGAFIRAASAMWPRASIVGVDIDPHVETDAPPFERCVQDFREHSGEYELIVGNPPFSEAQAHVEHALSLLSERGTLAFLMRVGFLESKARFEFNRNHMPREVHVLDRRPKFTGKGSDSTPYALFIWGKHERTQPAELYVTSWGKAA